MNAAATVTYAGFWKRFAAYLIDWLILMAGGFIIGFIVGMLIAFALLAAGGDPNTLSNYANAIGNIIGIMISWLYYALMESSGKQATVGKMALGIKVTDINGRRISFVRASGRFFGKFLSALILFIGFIMIAFTERKQGLHDMLADTLVINSESPAPPQTQTTGQISA